MSVSSFLTPYSLLVFAIGKEIEDCSRMPFPQTLDPCLVKVGNNADVVCSDIDAGKPVDLPDE